MNNPGESAETNVQSYDSLSSLDGKNKESPTLEDV